MTGTEKPRRLPGSYCPLWRKDVSKVCHTCELYTALPVTERGNPANEFTNWGCAFNHALTISRDFGAIADGTQKATEQLRNYIAKGVGAMTGAIAQRNGSTLIENDDPSLT